MKTAIKLVLIYLVVLQILSPLLVLIPCALYLWATTGEVTQQTLFQTILIPAQMTGILLMAFYLWKAGYISREKVTWAPVSASYLALSVLILLASTCLISELVEHLDLPNIMESTFSVLQSGWIGVLAIAVAGPVLEELLFRGAVTKALLQQYNPVVAILLSALLFGVFHINPVQIVPAFLLGILFAWIYYKTASLIPCILMHVVNNSLAVYFNIKYPEEENLDVLIGNTANLVVICLAAIIFVLCYRAMRRTSVPYPWKKKEENIDILTNND